MVKQKEMLWDSTPLFNGYQFLWILTISLSFSPLTGKALRLLK
jgi:hypothetical protein